MKIQLQHYTKVNGTGLSTLQMIMFHHISSKNCSGFSKRLSKQFGESVATKETALMELITQIETFTNGVMFRKATGQTAGMMIKPFNYTIKPFLEVQKRGSEHLITEIDEDDKGYLQLLKQDLWGVLIKLY